MSMREGWRGEAENWIRFARTPGHDRSFWEFGLQQMLDLIPVRGGLVVDVGCGEGRFPRELAARGYRALGVDASFEAIRAAAEAGGGFVVADAARLPIRDASAAAAIAHMSLHDFDDLDGALREIARVLEPGGVFCFSIVHPINTAGTFNRREGNAPFVIEGSYLDSRPYTYTSERDGITITFHSVHRSLGSYLGALERVGLLVQSFREPPVPEAWLDDAAEGRWVRLPLFLFVRAVKPN